MCVFLFIYVHMCVQLTQRICWHVQICMPFLLSLASVSSHSVFFLYDLKFFCHYHGILIVVIEMVLHWIVIWFGVRKWKWKVTECTKNTVALFYMYNWNTKQNTLKFEAVVIFCFLFFTWNGVVDWIFRCVCHNRETVWFQFILLHISRVFLLSIVDKIHCLFSGNQKQLSHTISLAFDPITAKLSDFKGNK